LLDDVARKTCPHFQAHNAHLPDESQSTRASPFFSTLFLGDPTLTGKIESLEINMHAEEKPAFQIEEYCELLINLGKVLDCLQKHDLLTLQTHIELCRARVCERLRPEIEEFLAIEA
jgi:hypothetical protein